MAASAFNTPAPGGERIAVIGMACLFPGAANLDDFWANVLAKVDAVTDPPPGSWDPDVHYDPESSESDRIYAKRGGYIADMASFDPLSHGVPPSAVGGEPDQWLALDIARRALEDAGYLELEEEVRRKTAVILGRGALPNTGTLTAIQHGLIVSQTLRILSDLNPQMPAAQREQIRVALRSSLPEFGPDTAPGFVPNLIVGRIANRLDLMGPNMTVDAACASSHVAVEIAINELARGTCDLALAGGSHVWTPVPMLGLFSQLGALSRADRIRPFDAQADGTLLGEGLGMVVLKRLADAERDDDRIYAVIRGVGVASDGKAIGVMAPRVEGEELALRRAYEIAQVPPETIGLIEAHGTGTAVGDMVEIAALDRIFGEREGELPTVALGSVKSMIGHLVPAAGVAALIKTSLALYHKVLPPTINVEVPNPELARASTPLYVNADVRPWINSRQHPRRAGVSAFGFGGIDAHIVLEEHVESDDHGARPLDHLPAWGSEVVVVSAANQAELADRVRTLAERVAATASAARPARLQDVAHSINRAAASDGSSAVLSVVAESTADLAQGLSRAAQRLSDPGCSRIKDPSGIFYSSQPLARRGKVCFLFPGEGAQYQDMLADLCIGLPTVREVFDAADRYFRARGRPILPSDYIFPRHAFTDDERRWAEEQLWDMDNAVSAVLIADEALFQVLDGLGVRPDGVVGHSSGEFAALRAAGVLGDRPGGAEMAFYDMLAEVGRTLADEDGVPPAALSAIGAGRADAESLIDGLDVWVAADNCPHQVVLAADLGAADQLQRRVKGRGLVAESLPFGRSYHTEQFAPLSKRLRHALSEFQLLEPRVPVYSCATTRSIDGDIATMAADQWTRPVEFRKTIEQMYADGYRVFVEVGPRGNLTSFVEDTLRGSEFAAIAANQLRVPGLRQLNMAVGVLAAEGVPVDLGFLHRHRDSQVVDFEALVGRDVADADTHAVRLNTGFPEMSINVAAIQGNPARLPAPVATPGATAGATAVVEATAPPASAPVPGGELARVSARFLETMDHFLSVQERVMLQYLGSPHAAAPAPARRSDGRNGNRPSSQPSNELLHLPVAVPVESAPASVALDLPSALPTMLIEIVVDRTGYPADVISLDADLEADLGIDSIKRVEILTALRRRVAHAGEVDLQVLTTKRTLNEIIGALSAAWR